MSFVPLFVVLLILIDKYCFSHVLQRPLIACTLLGASLGCLKESMVVGSSLELYYIAYQSYGEYSPIESGFLMTSIMSTLLVSGGTDSSNAISSCVVFLACGMLISYLLSLVNNVFVPLARSSAEKKNEKTLFFTIFVPFILDVIVYGFLTTFALQNTNALQTIASTLGSNYSWLMTGLSCIAILMSCISFAILLRNIGVKDVPGVVAAGVAVGVLLSLITSTGVISGGLVGLLAIALAFYDYHTQKKQPTKQTSEVENKPKNTMKGGAEKWW